MNKDPVNNKIEVYWEDSYFNNMNGSCREREIEIENERFRLKIVISNRTIIEYITKHIKLLKKQ